MAVNSVADMPLVAGASRRGVGLWAKQVQTGATANGGGANLTVQTPFKEVLSAVATISAAAPPGATAVIVVAQVNASNKSQVLLERYSADASATPAWVDATTDLLVNLVVAGLE